VYKRDSGRGPSRGFEKNQEHGLTGEKQHAEKNEFKESRGGHRVELLGKASTGKKSNTGGGGGSYQGGRTWGNPSAVKENKARKKGKRRSVKDRRVQAPITA